LSISHINKKQIEKKPYGTYAYPSPREDEKKHKFKIDSLEVKKAPAGMVNRGAVISYRKSEE